MPKAARVKTTLFVIIVFLIMVSGEIIEEQLAKDISEAFRKLKDEWRLWENY